MLQRAFVILSLILLSIIVVRPIQGSDLIVKKPVKISDQQIPTILSSQKTLKSGNHLMQSPGTVLDSTYYDWQSSGGFDDHLATFDDFGTIKINASWVVAYDINPINPSIAYYYWNGSSWMGQGATIFPTRTGYGAMSQYPDGRVVIATHLNDDSLATRCYVAIDSFVGMYAFSFTIAPDTIATFPRITVNTDNSIVMTGISEIPFNDIVNEVMWIRSASGQFGKWQHFSDIAPDWIHDDMEPPTIHSGINGKVGVVIPDYAGSVRLFESTDYGESFDVISIAPGDTGNLPAGLDSTAARLGWINSDIMYIGDDPHIVWTAGQGARVNDEYGLLDFKTTIFHWSPLTGIDTVVVAATQSADPSRNDYVPTPSNHLSVDWPSIGVQTDGQSLVVAFTALNPYDIDSMAIPSPLGYLDIWMTESRDNGVTWSYPINVTNNDGTILGWDDRYPSVAKVCIDNSADPGNDAYMIYQTDDLAGTYVQGTEGLLNMDYIKFMGVYEIGGLGIGGGEVPNFNIPRTASLSQNYPNPFNPSTTIRYDIPVGSSTVPVKINIYDIRGRLIRKLVDQEKTSGRYQVHWDGRGEHGQQASSGVYLYRIDTGEFISTRKMVLVQ
jgi:hypothetical protein